MNELQIFHLAKKYTRTFFSHSRPEQCWKQNTKVTPNITIILGQIVITLPWKFWQCMMWFDWSKWIMWKMKKISYPKFIIHLLLIYYGFTRTKICSTCYSHMSVVANYFHICEGYYRLHGWLAWFMVIWKPVPIILQKCVTFSTSELTTDLKRWSGTFGNFIHLL